MFNRIVNQLISVKTTLRSIGLLTLLLLLCTASSSVMAGKPGLTGNTTENCNEETIVSNSALFTQHVSGLIDSFYRKRVKNDHFNGCVMVAKDGKPIYQAAFGYGNLTFKDTLSTKSSFQLASVSKTFTASAVLLLAEQGFISLDDSVQKFFPDFPYHDITVKLLLSHRTGLPDYTYWDKYFIGNVPYLTNQGLMEVLATKKPQVRCKPDHMFIYCNTNYAILAAIVEKASGMSFKKFMHEVVFAPLGMENTYVFSPEEGGTCCTISYDSKGRLWKDCPADGVVGDKGIYSSVEDMLKWDNALRTGLVLSQESLQEAYKPRSLDRYSFGKDKSRNYGYGWRMIKQPDKSYLIYHNGFWHGSNNVFARDLNNGFTIIVLGNKSNHANYWTQPVWNALGQIKDLDAENVAEVQ